MLRGSIDNFTARAVYYLRYEAVAQVEEGVAGGAGKEEAVVLQEGADGRGGGTALTLALALILAGVVC